jgi:hypothetical protein
VVAAGAIMAHSGAGPGSAADAIRVGHYVDDPVAVRILTDEALACSTVSEPTSGAAGFVVNRGTSLPDPDFAVVMGRMHGHHFSKHIKQYLYRYDTLRLAQKAGCILARSSSFNSTPQSCEGVLIGALARSRVVGSVFLIMIPDENDSYR